MRHITALFIAMLLIGAALPVRASSTLIDDSQQLYNATQQAINAYCTNAPKPAAQRHTNCADAISTIVKGFATQYAVQFQRGGAVAQQNENFGAFADYNLKRNCLNNDTALTASLQCIRSIHALENDKGHSGQFDDGGQDFSYDRSQVKTAFNQQLFDLISMGTICAYGVQHRAAAEQGVCQSNAAKYGLKFVR